MRDMSSEAPYARGNEASRQAADGVKHQLTGIRSKVMDLIVSRGTFGATGDEIATALDMGWNTVKPRCTELKDAGYIRDSGALRRNGNGRNETVWVVAESPPTGPWLKKLRASAEGLPSGLYVFRAATHRNPLGIAAIFKREEIELILADLEVAVAISRKGRS